MKHSVGHVLERTAEDLGIVVELLFITIPYNIYSTSRDALRQLRW